MFGEHRLPACWFWRLAKTIFQIRRSLREIVVRTLPTTAGWQPALPLKEVLTRNQNPALIGHMKTKTIVLPLALCFAAGTVCFAASPQMGTWKLNEAKSKHAPGTPKNNMVVYEAVGGKVKVTLDGTDANGKTAHNEWTGKFDGKDYPVTGDPNSDARSYKKIDDRTLDFTIKKGGKVTITGRIVKVTITGRIVVSADRKSRTVTTNGTDAKGKSFKNTAVYDKQ
jgi:hypothetical protein